ncbi:MAG TPA: DUF1805 domain-containing protein [Candidatus Omnitrophica bacterium]|nr:DUF1805 domain-containing protein [Candidatus Omnitrophota bacterium]
MEVKKIKAGKKFVEAILIKLLSKNLIILKGSSGYLNLKVANKFGDAAVKIVKVSTIKDALKTKIESASNKAKKLGIYKGRAVKDALKIIA